MYFSLYGVCDARAREVVRWRRRTTRGCIETKGLAQYYVFLILRADRVAPEARWRVCYVVRYLLRQPPRHWACQRRIPPHMHGTLGSVRSTYACTTCRFDARQCLNPAQSHAQENNQRRNRTRGRRSSSRSTNRARRRLRSWRTEKPPLPQHGIRRTQYRFRFVPMRENQWCR